MGERLAEGIGLQCGDCRAELAKMPAALFDSAVTDPPYELEFMGKQWDASGVSFAPETWHAVLRVLKPGGHLLAFGGTRTYHRMACAIEDAGFEIRDTVSWLYGNGWPKNPDTALKPACELIALARRPLAKANVATNALKWKTGRLSIDKARVGTSKRVPASPSKTPNAIYGKGVGGSGSMDGSGFNANIGRWPANVIHDGSDEVVALFPETKPTTASTTYNHALRQSVAKGRERPHVTSHYGDPAGSAARYFYCAKASAAERAGSRHPTVKPVALMQYLCRLITPPGGIVLDPFAGTGTTGEACLREGLRAILIERDPAYCDDIRRRLARATEAAPANPSAHAVY